MDLAERILHHLSVHGSANSLELARKWQEDHQKMVGAVKSLECLDGFVQARIVSQKRWELTPEGVEVAQNGSHEAAVFYAIPASESIEQSELMKKVGAAKGKVGFSKAMSAGWLFIDKSGGKAMVKRKLANISDVIQEHLSQLSQGRDVPGLSDKTKEEYKKRKLLQPVVVKLHELEKGANFSTTITKSETELTPEMISSGAWKTAKFKAYNFAALGQAPLAGHLHPLLKVRAEFRQIFLEMGFSEMPTNNFVESSFWNFDALFQPQQHPARDAHDTFFISDPAQTVKFPQDYLEKVKKVHSSGGYGSQGYGYDWKIEEAQKNLLRTHTTAVSARMLHKLGQGPFKPQKYFSIDRVFRNETLDATHLAEFYHNEGVIADYGLSLKDLIGVFNEFFNKLGLKRLRYKPAYNPYTEPSMEIFAYHEGLKKWVEVGNSGMFRPEMLLPMGLPEGVNVLAWGLSLERPTMIKYGINNIRDLCGHKVNLKLVNEMPIVRLDKHSSDPTDTLLALTQRRQDAIQCKLETLRRRLGLASFDQLATSLSSSAGAVPRSIVIHANLACPPHSVRLFVAALAKSRKVCAQTHVHSSLRPNQVSGQLVDFLMLNEDLSRTDCDVSVTFIWKACRRVTLLVGRAAIQGEVDVARYFSRLLGPDHTPYDQGTLANEPLAAYMDSQLDLVQQLLSVKSGSKGEAAALQGLAKSLDKSTSLPWLSGKNFSIVDVLMWSYFVRNKSSCLKAKDWKAWHQRCLKHEAIRRI